MDGVASAHDPKEEDMYNVAGESPRQQRCIQGSYAAQC